jgi:hypothetical protein
MRMYGLHRNHVIAVLAGALLGAVISFLAGALGFALALNDGIFWGAVIGGIVAGIPQFAQSGAVLTQGTNSLWNLLVGLVGGVVFLIAIAALATVVWALLF